MKNNLREIIDEFLNRFCIKVDPEAFMDEGVNELYCDDHNYIEYGDFGYYIPGNNSFFTDDDELLSIMLINTYSL